MDTWILLRGLTREAGHWGGFAADLERALPGARVVVLDLPGNGELHERRSPTRVEDMAMHCRVQMAALGIAPPYRLLAMSLGAMVAVTWSAAHPREIASQVLINTSMRPFNPFYQRLRPANYARIAALALTAASPRRWEWAVLAMTSHLRGTEVPALWLELRQRHPVSRANALRQLAAAACFRAPDHAPAVPTLLFASACDRLVSIQCSRTLASRWGVPLRVHPAAGHDLPLDDGAWVVECVRRWTQALEQT